LPVDMETVSSIKNFVVDDMRVCPKVSRLSW
jgi:hypothetical protein